MEIKLLSCPLCLQPHFEGVDSLRSTLVSVATSHLSCPVCSESLLGLDKLTIHLFSHVNNVHVAHKINNIANETIQEEINKSIDRIANNQQQPLAGVERCQKTASTCSFETAGNEFLDNNQNSVKCDICNFSFNDQNILDMHQKLLHQTSPDKRTGLYSYHCHLCSKKFKMRGSLMVHLRVAHYGFDHQNVIDNNNDTNCSNDSEPCTSSMSNEMPPQNRVSEEKDQAKINVKNVLKFGPNKPMDNKQWECDVCSKMFTTKYFLKKHKRLHTGEMPYCCTQCNKSFTFQQSYHKHMLYHSSEKPYVCNECGRAFKELSTLQNHARIHSGERPFACETCGKRFRQRVSYLVHRRIHTGVMPYKCTACEKTFRYKVSQRSHKCPMNPPGSVVRVPDSPEKTNDVYTETPAMNNVKCIMSVDYNTGNINLIPENNLNIVYVNGYNALQKNQAPSVGGTNHLMHVDCGLRQAVDSVNTQLSLCVSNNDNKDSAQNVQKDMLSVLSPLLPEVASLCLNNSPVNSPSENAQDDSMDTILFGNK